MKTWKTFFTLSLILGTVLARADEPKKEPKAETSTDEKKPAATPAYADPGKLTEKAPDTFDAQFDTTKGKFTIEVTRSLAPNGADRFYNLVRSGYFRDIA